MQKVKRAFLLICVSFSIGYSPISSAELRDSEFTLKNLEWGSVTDKSFPASARKIFRKLVDLEPENYPESSYWFAFVDLNGDGKKEIILDDPPAGGSGGAIHYILKQRGKEWVAIGSFHGGLVFTQRDDNVKYEDNFYRIIVYYRSGDTYQQVFDYKGGRYRFTSEVMLPRAITQTPSWQKLWEQMN
jgi:hypothetical protein